MPRGSYMVSSWRHLGRVALHDRTARRSFQVIQRGHDRQQESLYDKLGFSADSEAERIQRSPEELLQGFVQEAMKLKDPENDPAEKARLEDMKQAYRLLRDPLFRANYSRHYYASNDAQLNVLQDGGQVGANFNPEHQSFVFVDHAAGHASLHSSHGGDRESASTLAGSSSLGGGEDASAAASASVGDFREAFRNATGASDPRTVRPHNAAEASAPLGGADIHFTLKLTFSEALSGCTKRIRLLKHTKCRRCRGSGVQSLKKARACPQCMGRGAVHLPSSTYHIERRCNYCGGEGHMPPPRCPACAGRSVLLEQEVEMPVTVPPQTRNLSVFRMAGLGHDGVRGGGPGCLLLTVMVQEHRHLYQDAAGTLHAMLPLPLSMALLGGLVPVPAVRDANTRAVPVLRVPPCVRNGQLLRLREYGVLPPTIDGGRITDGPDAFAQDVLFHVLVMTPRVADLTGRQLEALGLYEAATGEASSEAPAVDPVQGGETVSEKDAFMAQCAALKTQYNHWLPQD